jgi:hypothetical protein
MTTEARWFASNSPASLLYTVKQKKLLKPRKAMLFACGCYRLVWDKIGLKGVREVIEKAEARADKQITQNELRTYRYTRGNPAQGSSDEYLQLSLGSLVTPKMLPMHIAWLVRAAFEPSMWQHANKWEECKPQADLVREIFGNPFKPVTFAKAWRTDTVLTLAHTMYESREFSAMPILADALQDAGCENEAVLAHCRDAKQVHVRGCWVVDLVLGKA